MAASATKSLSPEQEQELEDVFARARAALAIIETYDQARVDRLIQAVAWAVANRSSFHRLVKMGIEESGLGDFDSRMNKRMKIRGVLRDALRSPSVGIIEEDAEKGLVKYGKPVGIIGCVVPTTNPDLTPAGNAIYAIKARDVVVFSPHPAFEAHDVRDRPPHARSARGGGRARRHPAVHHSAEPHRLAGDHAALRPRHRDGRPGTRARRVQLGHARVRRGSGQRDRVRRRDRRHRRDGAQLHAVQDVGLRLGLLGGRERPGAGGPIPARCSTRCRRRAGISRHPDERAALQGVMWDDEGHRLADTVAISPQALAKAAGFDIPSDRRFILVEGDGIGEDKQFCKEKLTTLMAVHKYEGSFEDGVELAKHLYDIGGKGHSCGIASTDDAHIDYFARHMPVSRIMVRQPNSKANAGSFTNGMPMTSSMGCGTWGGNITSENVSLRHYLNTTWVSRTIAEDRPSDEELFGDFYDAALEESVRSVSR